MTAPEWVVVTLKVIEALDTLGVPYVVGGSVASIVHGIVRTTVDSDASSDFGSAVVNFIEPPARSIMRSYQLPFDAI